MVTPLSWGRRGAGQCLARGEDSATSALVIIAQKQTHGRADTRGDCRGPAIWQEQREGHGVCARISVGLPQEVTLMRAQARILTAPGQRAGCYFLHVCHFALIGCIHYAYSFSLFLTHSQK